LSDNRNQKENKINDTNIIKYEWEGNKYSSMCWVPIK